MSGDDNYKRSNAGPINTFQADPVFAVIDGPGGINKLFTSPRATRLPLGFATAFMAQRCAQSVDSWDGYCDMYLKQESDANFTGKNATEFIRDTLSRMFCRNDTSIPGSQCIERCEMFDPTSNNSAQVCRTQGDLVYRSSEKVSALDTLYPQTGKLQTASPLRFTKCPKICDIFDPEKLSDRNVPLNLALDRGICMDIIQNLIENLVTAQKTDVVTNQRLLRLMNAYVQNGQVKPGLYNLGAGPYVSSAQVATPATVPYLPPNETLIVNENRTITGPSPIVNVTPQLTETQLAEDSNVEGASGEPFGFIDLDQDNDKDPNSSLYMILIIAFVVVLLLCIGKKTASK